MKKISRFILTIFSITFLILLSGCGRAPSSPNNDTNNNMEGNGGGGGSDNETMEEAAPDFTYTSLGGVKYTLSSLEGKVVYIFFFGANCPHCRENGPVTETDIYQKFKSNANFVALGLDTWNTSASEVQNFKDVTGITYTLLLNAKESLIDYYGDTSSYDRSVVISGDGHIAYKGNGFVDTDSDKVVDAIENELSKL